MATQYCSKVIVLSLWSVYGCQWLLTLSSSFDTITQYFTVRIVNVYVVWHREFPLMSDSFLPAKFKIGLRSVFAFRLNRLEYFWAALIFIFILRDIVLPLINPLTCLVELCEATRYIGLFSSTDRTNRPVLQIICAQRRGNCFSTFIKLGIFQVTDARLRYFEGIRSLFALHFIEFCNCLYLPWRKDGLLLHSPLLEIITSYITFLTITDLLSLLSVNYISSYLGIRIELQESVLECNRFDSLSHFIDFDIFKRDPLGPVAFVDHKWLHILSCIRKTLGVRFLYFNLLVSHIISGICWHGASKGIFQWCRSLTGYGVEVATGQNWL